MKYFLFFANILLLPLKVLQKILSQFFLIVHLLIHKPEIYLPYFYNKVRITMTSFLKDFKIKLITLKNFILPINKPLFKSILMIFRILWYLSGVIGGGLILTTFLNPLSDIFTNIKQWFDSFLEVSIINRALNWTKSLLDNLSNWIDSITNKKDFSKVNNLEMKESESDLENLEQSLRKSYSFNNKVESDSVETSSTSNKDNTLHNYGKYILIAAGIVVIGAVLYYYKDSILSYISSEKTSKGVNTDSSPTSTSSSNLNEENYKKFFKSPDSSPTSSTTSDLIDLNSNSSPTSTSSSVTIKPNVSSSIHPYGQAGSESLPSSPESILIKPDSPEPKKILLRISRERLKELEDKDLSPLPSPFDNE